LKHTCRYVYKRRAGLPCQKNQNHGEDIQGRSEDENEDGCNWGESKRDFYHCAHWTITCGLAGWAIVGAYQQISIFLKTDFAVASTYNITLAEELSKSNFTVSLRSLDDIISEANNGSYVEAWTKLEELNDGLFSYWSSHYMETEIRRWAWTLLLPNEAIIFDRNSHDLERIPQGGNSSDIYETAVTRTIGDCKYEGTLYPTDGKGGYERFGGNSHTLIVVTVWIGFGFLCLTILIDAIPVRKGCEPLNIRLGRNVSRLLIKHRNFNPFAAQYRKDGKVSLENQEWIGGWIMAWLYLLLTIPLIVAMGTSIEKGVLVSGGFFRLRTLIVFLYNFLVATMILFTMIFIIGLHICCYPDLASWPKEKKFPWKGEIMDVQKDLEEGVSIMDEKWEKMRQTNKCMYCSTKYLLCLLSILWFSGLIAIITPVCIGFINMFNGILDSWYYNVPLLAYWLWTFNPSVRSKKKRLQNPVEAVELASKHTPTQKDMHKRQPEHVDNKAGSSNTSASAPSTPQTRNTN